MSSKSLERNPHHSVVYTGYPGMYANAFCFLRRFISAYHVTGKEQRIVDPHPIGRSDPLPKLDFVQVAYGIDISVSVAKTVSQGFLRYEVADLGDRVKVVGYHGDDHYPFSIQAIIDSIDTQGSLWITQNQNQYPFQLGMSGSVVLTREDNVVGVLTGKAGSSERRVAIQPITYITEYLGINQYFAPWVGLMRTTCVRS